MKYLVINLYIFSFYFQNKVISFYCLFFNSILNILIIIINFYYYIMIKFMYFYNPNILRSITINKLYYSINCYLYRSPNYF